jgi:hypothetical protein
LLHGYGGGPPAGLVFQNAEAHGAARENVGVENGRRKLGRGRLDWVVAAEMELELVGATLPIGANFAWQRALPPIGEAQGARAG